VIDYQVIRSKRKTLSLQVKLGVVIVRSPHFVDENYINSLVQKKSAWLKSKIAEQATIKNNHCDFSQGSQLFYLGQKVTLDINFGAKTKTSFSFNSNDEQTLTVTLAVRNKDKLMQYNLPQHKLPQDKSLQSNALAVKVKKHLELYFKQQAEHLMSLKTNHFSEITGLMPTTIKIRQYRARWGSCNNRGELSFNYLMMMLPDEVINYIVLHELCHLRHLNHSPLFWQLVAKHFPNYRQAMQWLKTHQSSLLWRLD